MGPKNLTTLAHFIMSPRPTPRGKKWPRTDKESPNSLETLPRKILLLASQTPGGKNSTPTRKKRLRRKKWPRMDKESPNSLETLLRKILLSASQTPKRKEQHIGKEEMAEEEEMAEDGQRKPK